MDRSLVRTALCGCALLAACTQSQVSTPTRSLDRPADVAMVCARGTGANHNLEMRPLSECTSPTAFGQGDQPLQLYLLVAGETRGEVAAVYTGHPDGGSTPEAASVLDLDRDTPGFGFLRVGSLPEPLRASDDGKWAVTTNRGSCDLSVIDVLQTLKLGTGDTTVKGVPSAAVTRVEPRVGGRPLGARATWVEISPSSTARCPSGRCVFVAMPACELVAEVDLDSTAPTNITQAMRVGRSGASAISDLSSIRCAPECFLSGDAGATSPPDLATPEDLAVPSDDAATPADGGVSSGDGGSAIPTLPPMLPTDQAYPHTLAVDRTAGARHLVVGDAVTPNLTLIPLDAAGLFGVATSVTLDGTAQGVERVRISPGISDLQAAGDPFPPRFAYAIARDRTVRVVDIDGGFECETNPTIDAVQAVLQATLPGGDMIADLQQSDRSMWKTERALACLPVGKTARSAAAFSAGISLPGGALARDIAFSHNATLPVPASGQAALPAQSGLLFGWFGWIVDSQGRALAVNIADLCPQPNDPSVGQSDQLAIACVPSRFGLGLIVEADGTSRIGPASPAPSPFDLLPHRLRDANSRWSSTSSTTSGDVRLASSPITSVGTSALNLSDPAAAATATQLCNVVADPADPNNGRACTLATGAPLNYLAKPNPDLVPNEQWSIAWEGFVPGTARSSGSLNGNLLTDVAGLFCSRGVEAGDRLFLDGCVDDDGCAPDQQCFLDPQRPVGALGLCVDRAAASSPAVDPQQGACAPWTQSLLRYRISEVRQYVNVPGQTDRSEVRLEELYLPEHPADVKACVTDVDCADAPVATTRGNNEAIQLPTRCLDDGHGGRGCFVACDPAGKESFTCAPGKSCSSRECGNGFICAASALVPSETRCMRAPLPPRTGDVCASDNDCFRLNRGLPGTRCEAGRCAPVCFGGFQRYEIHGGESFIVVGDMNGFFNASYPDPATGACLQPPLSDPMHLSRGRIPFDAPACDPSVAQSFLAPLPAASPGSCLLPATDGRLIRYQNPLIGFVVRVPTRVITTGTSLPSALVNVPPDGANIRFSIIGGFRPLAATLSSDMAAELPRTAVIAPDNVTLYVVDQGLQTSTSGLRGQVLRFFTDTQSSDSTFQIR